MKKIVLIAIPCLAMLAACGGNKQSDNAADSTAAVKAAAPGSQDSLFKPVDIQEEMIYSRAIEAVNWGMPAVNYDLMYQAATGIKAAYNQIVYWSRLPDWKNQTLTPNPDVIYLMPFINTRD